MTMPALSLDKLQDLAALQARKAEWEACVQATGGDIYFAADWLLAWWAHYGRGRRFCAYLVHRDGVCIGALAFAIETFWLGPLPVRLARLAGADTNFPILSLPLDPATATPALAAILSDLTGAERCDGVALSPLSARARGIDAIAPAAQAAGLPVEERPTGHDHTLMPLPGDFDTWLAGLSKSRRREYRRDATGLAEAHQIATRVSAPDTVAERLEVFMALHTAQWQAIGKAGHFGDWPGSADFLREVVVRLAPSGRAMIQDHLADGRVLSSQLAFRQGETLYWRLVGRTGDPAFRAFGLGRVGLVERVREAIASGARQIEAAAGEYEYKLGYGGELVAIRRLMVLAPGARARLGLRLLLAWADLVNLLYYRLWFLKLAPRLRKVLGRQPRPLWRAWIRTRI